MLKPMITMLLCVSLLDAADLPIRQVVLYKHGVGYFERSGVIPAGDTARLDFKAEEMNDVLKSLMINGKTELVAGLRYDSSIPLDQKLADFPFRIDASQPLSGVLDQLKGSRVEMQIGSEKVAGDVVAARTVAAEKDHAERQHIVLLLDSGAMHTFDLDAASSIRFTDVKLQTQFRDYLGALTASRSKDKRSVYIDGNSTAARDITASYIIPAPIWKSSYRLLFPEAGEPVLEGWAIVDNTTGEDWNNVQMALVSGKPISFITELYSPRYIARQAAELPEQEAQRAIIYSGATSTAASVDGSGQADARFAPSAGLMLRQPMAKTSHSSQAPGNWFSQSSVVPSAMGFEVADLFEYRIAQPVTIKKNESAMLPFLQDKIKARKIVVYSDMSAAHPLNAAELTNSTAKTLDGGPITVYERGSYAGEALVETVKANDKRLISYGVDLGTRITANIGSEERQERDIHLSRGVLNVRAAVIRKTNYSIRNVDAKPKTLIIEHSLNEPFRVLNQKPFETTATANRFEVKLDASSSQTFPIIEERIQEESNAVSNLSPDVLLQFTANKDLSDAGRRAIEQIAALKREITTNSSQASLTGEKIKAATQDEERVRKNLGSLSGISGQQELVQKYAGQLAQLEQQIASLRDAQAALENKSTALQASLDDRLEKMTF